MKSIYLSIYLSSILPKDKQTLKWSVLKNESLKSQAYYHAKYTFLLIKTKMQMQLHCNN
jgi:hypothetical protein